jgi:hypothetical protein
MMLLKCQSSFRPIHEEDEKGFRHSGYAVKKTGERQFFKNNRISEKGRQFSSKSISTKKPEIENTPILNAPDPSEF